MANQYLRWEAYLAKMRALCHLLGIETYRRHMQKMLRHRPHPGANLQDLDHFVASFAKWRYETVPTVQAALLKARIICAQCVRQEWFEKPQDKEAIKSFLDACQDSDGDTRTP